MYSAINGYHFVSECNGKFLSPVPSAQSHAQWELPLKNLLHSVPNLQLMHNRTLSCVLRKHETRKLVNGKEGKMKQTHVLREVKENRKGILDMARGLAPQS